MKNFVYTPQVYSVDTPATDVRKDARKFAKAATTNGRTTLTNQLKHAAALAALDAQRKAGALVDDATGKPLTQNQLIEWVGTLKRAMFLRYVQAAKFTTLQVEDYVQDCEENQTAPNISGLIKAYATKKETEGPKPIGTLTKTKGESAGFNVTLFEDGTFKASTGADPKEVAKLVAAFKAFK